MSSVIPEHREDIERRLEAGESLRSIAARMGVTYQTLQYHRRRWGGAPIRKGNGREAAHASWRGGRSVTKAGYVLVLTRDGYRANPYVGEHILVAEEMLGRRLTTDEVVHHIDGDKGNNDWANLHVCSRAAHRQLHGQLERIAFGLLGRGVEFDPVTGYALTQDR